MSAWFFKSDDKKLCCLMPNNIDCHVGLTSCLLDWRSSMTKYQTNHGFSPVSPPFSITPCMMLTRHCLLTTIKTTMPVPGPVLDAQSYSILNTCYFRSKVGNCGSNKSETRVENQDQWYYNAQDLDQNQEFTCIFINYKKNMYLLKDIRVVVPHDLTM